MFDREFGHQKIEGCPEDRRARLAAARVWIAEQADNEHLIVENSPAPLTAALDAAACLGDHVGAIHELGDDPEVPLDGEALMGSVLALEKLRRRIDAASAALLGRLHHAGTTEIEAGLTTKRWKANRTHGSDAEISRQLTIASTLHRFSGFAGSLARGLIGTEHVLALAAASNPRVIDALVELESDLVLYAQRHRYPVYVRHLRYLVSLLDQDGPEPDCGDNDTCVMATDLEGHLHLAAELTGHNALSAQQLLDDETDRQYRLAVSEHEAAGSPVPPRQILRARALMHLLRNGATTLSGSSKPAVEATIAVTADSDGRSTGAWSANGSRLSPQTAALFACDASIRPIIVDSSGEPLRAGRTVRLFTARQRAALVLRDGGCVFPGCDAPPSWCDAHHITPFIQGGCTDVENGALLCRRHHGLVHSGSGWSLGRCTVASVDVPTAEHHAARAASARVEPSSHPLVWDSPDGHKVLAQNGIDHRGPAPPERCE